MYRGHGGLSLLLYSPLMFLFRGFGVDMNLIILTGFLMVVVSFMPDLDIPARRIRLRIRHRGITHTLLFGVVIGVSFSVMLGLVYGFPGWLMGFEAGFGGIASHLAGDVLTYERPQVKPFYPFSDKEVVFGLFKASDTTANNTMLALGVIAFTISYIILCSL